VLKPYTCPNESGSKRPKDSCLVPLGVFCKNIHANLNMPTKVNLNKRAQRALDRSPEENVHGHSAANNREPQGHNLNNFGRGPFDDVIY